MKKQILSLLTVLAGLLLWGCYPEGAEYVEDVDIVMSNYNDAYDFSAKSGTYSMPDKILKITGNVTDASLPEFVKQAYAAPILVQIENEMSKLGWTKVDTLQNPDLLLVPAAWETTTIYTYYNYYGWYGGYYGWYYPPVYTSSYTTGTFMMSLIDPKLMDVNGSAEIEWTGAINGLMTWTYDAGRINKAITQAFTQSPYLQTN